MRALFLNLPLVGRSECEAFRVGVTLHPLHHDPHPTRSLSLPCRPPHKGEVKE
jgi:hypothetical protein